MKRAIAVAFGFVLLLTVDFVVVAATRTVTLHVEGMTCGTCATDIEKALMATPGVLEAHVSFEKAEAWVRFDDRKVSVERIRKTIDDAGYRVVDSKPTGAAANCCPGKPHGGPGCTVEDTAETTAQNRSYSTDLTELRMRFNADKGKARVVLLLSPT